MIFACELQCKNISHVKVNSGFIYGLSLAYPKKIIQFIAHKSHFQEVRDLLVTHKISINLLRNTTINLKTSNNFSISGIVRHYIAIKNIFNQTILLKSSKVIFLSTSPIILFCIKLLKLQTKYRDICCTFVLHGELEDIANVHYQDPYTPVIPADKISPSSLGYRTRVLRSIDRVRTTITQLPLHPINYLSKQYTLVFKRIFRTKKLMNWHHSTQYNYVSLSPHVTKNAKRYLDTDHLNFHTIIMPIIFNKPSKQPSNQFIKFAVFGYGDSSQMHKVLQLLSKKKNDHPYEIRIISMDCRGTDGFPNINCLSNGKVLSNNAMEEAAKDIDVFINLYDDSRHNLGCSLSIFEALSHLKPVLHLSNPGYNYYNKPSAPIGYRVDSLEIFVAKMSDMINNYTSYTQEFKIFRQNILNIRREYNIKNNIPKLVKSLAYN